MSGWRAGLVAAVVGALVLGTGWLLERSSAPATAPDSPAAPQDDGSATEGAVLACASSSASACEGAAATLGIPSTSWDAGDPLPDRGLTLAPVSDLVESGVDPDDITIVASSPIVVGAWRDRSQILAASCGAIDLACVGSALGASWSDLGGPEAWGRFKVAMADPTQSDPGLIAWSAVVDAVPRSQLEQLPASLRVVGASEADVISEVLAFGDSRADVVVGSEAIVLAQAVNAPGRGGRLEIFHLPQGPWVEFGAVTSGLLSGGLLDDILTPDVAAALTAAGLRPEVGLTGEVPPEMEGVGERTPVPDDAARATLIGLWEELR